MKLDPFRLLILLCVGLGGFAGLGWESIWQIKASLAIGVSSQATAIVIAATMGGMALGTVLAGTLLQRHASRWNPLVLYALLETVVGVCGLLVHGEFALVASLDVRAWQTAPGAASLLHLGLIAATLGPPAMAMGATIPVLGLIGEQTRTSLGVLYGINTLGAALGTLSMAFVVLPRTGIVLATVCLAVVNLGIAAILVLNRNRPLEAPVQEGQPFPSGTWAPPFFAAAFLSGFAIFALEVVWFRAMRAAFLSTTTSFAVMLGSVLLALAVGAHAARLLPADRASLSLVLVSGGFATVITTPLIERLDALTSFFLIDPHLSKLLLSLGVIGPSVAMLGVVFPLLLDNSHSPREWGLLHASNTVGAIAGALGAAWWLLPALGIAGTSWLVSALLLAAGIVGLPETSARIRWSVLGAAGLGLAVGGQSGIGKTRILAQRGDLRASAGFEVVGFRETADFTVSVVEHAGMRALYIDGFDASPDRHRASYMAWMGRLPMLMHADPRDALVICFGRGETANAVREEGSERLDIVDISAAVFEMAPLFAANEEILADPRVHPIVMDGRKWLRRTTQQYDVITLEPMPPTFSGMNSLYSQEFYTLARGRLRDGGTIAQWVPFHLITADQASAIARTFAEVFPDAVMWMYPEYRAGILVGRKGPVAWPGLDRPAAGRELDRDAILGAVQLDPAALARYVEGARIITDDNQFLAYSADSRGHDFGPELGLKFEAESLERMKTARNP